MKWLNRNSAKIFCISFQRTGTTSVGKFFMDHGYKVATWSVSRRNKWTLSWFKGDYETIFNSKDFKASQVFEDDPWWCLDFYKILFHRYPKAKFVLLERDANEWYDSMIKHSNGKTLGNTHRHSFIYGRLSEYYLEDQDKKSAYTHELDNLLPLNEDLREHYIKIYRERIEEVKLFFRIHDSDRLLYGRLEDPKIWYKMGHFFKLKVGEGYNVHENASNIHPTE